jgi:hypothetical protein
VPFVETAPPLVTVMSDDDEVVSNVTGPLLPVVSIWSVKVPLAPVVVVFVVGLL